MKTIGIVSAALLSVAASAHAQGVQFNNLDITGIKLGMTEAEVMRAVKAADPTARVMNRIVSYYPYSDGVKGFQTSEFLSELEFRTANQSTFRIWFASPPSEPRAFAIMRNAFDRNNPPSRQQFTAALTAKYGQTQFHYVPNTGSNVGQWSEPGKPECAVSSNARIAIDGSNETLLPSGAVGAVDVLERMARSKNPNLLRNMGTSIDVARCGTVLRYTWGGPPNDPAFAISEFTAWLVDQGGMVKAQRKSDQWVKQLEAEAVGKRQGAVPRL